ncbi:MAG: hypothetical protein H0T63_04820 [Pyrinomonadaceae bacterium]|nr:hypothetical protein [Pyrinomonadaceae bacterium]
MKPISEWGTSAMTPKSRGEKAWVVFGLLVFVAHRILEVNDSTGGAAGKLMLLLEVIMLAMTFPLGSVAMLFLGLLTVSCESCRDLEWTLDWNTLMFVGYLQWFWVIPELRRRNKLTLLDLSPRRAAEASSHGELSAAAAGLFPVLLPQTATALPQEFDEEGRTPLERVLEL